MRADKRASLRQRLRRGADAFEFSALIEGVSTLEDNTPTPTAPEAGTGILPIPEAAETPPPSLIKAKEADAPPLSPTPERLPAPANGREERLRAALDALGCRLLQEASRLRAAMRARDAEEAGFCLAHVNQIMELLHSVDRAGDLARQMETTAAPPEGCAWPGVAWSFIEFAESPWSALLPPDANEAFARQILYSAWGVRFEGSGEPLGK